VIAVSQLVNRETLDAQYSYSRSLDASHLSIVSRAKEGSDLNLEATGSTIRRRSSNLLSLVIATAVAPVSAYAIRPCGWCTRIENRLSSVAMASG
jgi:hypothetical protein